MQTPRNRAWARFVILAVEPLHCAFKTVTFEGQPFGLWRFGCMFMVDVAFCVTMPRRMALSWH